MNMPKNPTSSPRISRFALPERQDRPDEFRAFSADHGALMDKPGALSKAERKMIVVATRQANDAMGR